MARLQTAEDFRLAALNGRRTGGTPFDRFIGPEYPDMGAAVATFRRKAAAAGSISAMSRADRQAYGATVERAILAKQRAALEAFRARGKCSMSETSRGYGDALLGRLNGALLACPAQERAARKPEMWRQMYDAAMVAKAMAGAPSWLAQHPAAPSPVAIAPEPKLNPAQKAWVTRRAKAAERIAA